jgi:transposase
MYLKKAVNKKTGRTYLSMVHSFRDKERGHARPVYLSREERINAHFLICFICLVVIRLIQKRTNNQYSPAKLIEAMNNISCSNEDSNLYLFDYRNDITDQLGATFDLDFSKKRLTRAQIKKILSEAKKG